MEKAEISSKLLEEIKKIEQISARQLDLARKAQAKKNLSDEVYRLMDEREAIRKEIEQIKGEFPDASSVMDILNPDDGKKLQELIKNIEVNDNESNSIVGALMVNLQNKIQSARINRKAVQAYSPPSLDSPWFFDKKK